MGPVLASDPMRRITELTPDELTKLIRGAVFYGASTTILFWSLLLGLLYLVLAIVQM